MGKLRGLRPLLGLAALVACVVAAVAQSRLDAHKQMTAAFNDTLKREGPDAAFEAAKKALIDSNRLPAADPRRTDALELVVRAQMAREAWAEVAAIADEVVRRRRSERPVEPEILALALGNRGVVEFALDRAADADRTFREQLAVYRDAFGAGDTRLADKLELQAEHVQKPYKRWRTAAALYREALAIRLKNADAPPHRLAQIHQNLALVQIELSEFGEADTNNSEAERLMEAAIMARPGDDDLKAGLVQLLVVHAGIEFRRGPKNRGAGLLERARAVPIADRDTAAEGKFLIAVAGANGAEADGDVAAAIAKLSEALDIALSNRHLADLAPDVMLRQAAMHLWSGGVVDGRRLLLELLEQAGGEAKANEPLLFQLAELARLEGRSADQKRLYQRALRSRKEAAAETVVLFATNRKASDAGASVFGNERAAGLTYGEAVVQVPGGQFSKEAALEPYQASPAPVGAATNAAAIAITAKSTAEKGRWAELVRSRAPAAKLYAGSVLIFIHGYNNSFDDALRRTAQLVRDLNFDGPAFSFAWASQGSALRYGADLEGAAQAVEACAEMISQVASAAGIARIHVIAHSMGNRILLPAIARLPSSVQSRLGEIVLASPAIDVASFRSALDRAKAAGVDRFTLYASGRDKALLAGFYREFGTSLAGFVTADEPIVHPAVDSIDVSEAGNAVETTNLNHDIFATNPVVIEDMRQLLQRGTRPPRQRLPIMEQRLTRDGAVFWKYRALQE